MHTGNKVSQRGKQNMEPEVMVTQNKGNNKNNMDNNVHNGN